MKLYMIFVGDWLKEVHKSEREAKRAAKLIRQSYWPKLEIIEVPVDNCRVIKTYRAEPECDPLR